MAINYPDIIGCTISDFPNILYEGQEQIPLILNPAVVVQILLALVAKILEANFVVIIVAIAMGALDSIGFGGILLDHAFLCVVGPLHGLFGCI
jgi:hypothetical protein